MDTSKLRETSVKLPSTRSALPKCACLLRHWRALTLSPSEVSLSAPTIFFHSCCSVARWFNRPSYARFLTLLVRSVPNCQTESVSAKLALFCSLVLSSQPVSGVAQQSFSGKSKDAAVKRRKCNFTGNLMPNNRDYAPKI